MKNLFILSIVSVMSLCSASSQDFTRVQFNNPGLTVDLGVGLWAWPMPMDWDGDGDYDLVVSCPDVPYNGTWFFENPEGDVKFPVFKPGVKVGRGMKNLQVSYVNGEPRVLDSSREFVDFAENGFSKTKTIHPTDRIHESTGNQRFNVWSYVDYDGDGLTDIMVGADDWGYFGWDDGYDAEGKWKRGPLHGLVYILRNKGLNEEPNYEDPFRVQADGEDVNVYGNPMPNLADFDGDGDLDLICGEFLDGFTWFENTGSRKQPVFAEGRRFARGDEPVHMHVQMITPTAIDWDRDGDVDIVCGDEDGRVALIENTGRVSDRMPVFRQPRYFQQQAEDLKFGALVTPVSVDWDADGDEDLIAGNTSGNIAFIENLDGAPSPRWAAPVLLQGEGRPVHIQAGPNGSIQGPAEAKWGYTTLDVADWDHDGLLDLVVNSIWGRVVWYRNVGSKSKPKLSAEQSVNVRWNGEPPKPAWNWWKPAKDELATQWRTTPVVVDWDEDGLNDLVMLDHEGYLAFYEREKIDGELVLLPGRRIFHGETFDSKGRVKGDGDGWLRLNSGTNGGSGRRKFCIVDWDGDGLRDLLVNSENINFLRNMGEQDGKIRFEDQGPVAAQKLAGHTTSPTIVDWNDDGKPELLVGSEDGRFYYLKNRNR